MPKNKSASHDKVIQAAKQEFYKYGFEKASMRRIGDRCDMSAAGLYRHCKDKEDLFSQVVEPAVTRVEDYLKEHKSRGFHALENEKAELFNDSQINMMIEIVYPNMDEYRLLLNCAQGTRYENFMHKMVEESEEDMMRLMSLLIEKGYLAHKVSREEMHILLSAYTTALFEPVLHNFSLEKAIDCAKTLELFFMPGWKRIMGFLPEEN